MKTIFKIIVIALVMMVSAISTFAQITATATTTATIVTPINLIKQVDMNFGNLAVTNMAGTCILTPASTRSITGGVTMPVVAGTVTAASFDVSGNPSYTYSITLPSTNLIITNTTGSGGETMIVNAFTSTPTPTGVLSLSGAQTLTVGATVNVAALQMAGVYVSATPFNVTVNYN